MKKLIITKIVFLVFIILLVVMFSSCGVRVKGNCSGNKTMSYYGGYSRKPFKN